MDWISCVDRVAKCSAATFKEFVKIDDALTFKAAASDKTEDVIAFVKGTRGSKPTHLVDYCTLHNLHISNSEEKLVSSQTQMKEVIIDVTANAILKTTTFAFGAFSPTHMPCYTVKYVSSGYTIHARNYLCI